MTTEQWAAFLSVLAALIVTLASFRQWVTVTVDGDTPLRGWAKVMLGCASALLVASLVLLSVGVLGD